MEHDAVRPEPDLRLPSEEEQRKAEELIRQHVVLLRRGEKAAARDAIDKAVELAPGSKDVALAEADWLIANRRTPKAVERLKAVRALYPEDKDLENRYAEVVLAQFESSQLLDELSSFEKWNESRIATWLSLLIPGLGQAYLGRWKFAIGCFSIWLVAIIWIALIPNGFRGLFGLFGIGANAGITFNPVVLLPLFMACCALVASIGNASVNARKFRSQKIERPEPPVDQPF